MHNQVQKNIKKRKVANLSSVPLTQSETNVLIKGISFPLHQVTLIKINSLKIWIISTEYTD